MGKSFLCKSYTFQVFLYFWQTIATMIAADTLSKT